MQNRRTKVLAVVDTLGVGGAETWLMELLRFWSANGAVQMDFLCTSGNHGVFDAEAVSLGATVHYVRYSRRSAVQFARAFRRILASGQYDAIHNHQAYTSGIHFALGLGHLPKVRVAHLHTHYKGNITTNYNVNIARRMVTGVGFHLTKSLSSHVCGTSAAMIEQYGFTIGQRRPAVSVLHCGISTATFHARRSEDDARAVRSEFGWPENTKVVLFAGRLDQSLDVGHPQNHKNSMFALHVICSAIERDPSIRFIMAGDGNRDDYEARIAQWPCRDKIRLVGVRRDIPRLMRASDVLLFPSIEEGLGMVAVEAQATGLPVLASTGVPQESRVIPRLCEYLPLDRPLDEWVSALLRRVAAPRGSPEECAAAFKASPFTIAASAERLATIYSAGYPAV